MTTAATLVSLALGTLVSEDLTTITAGVLAGEGRVQPALAILACAAGIYAGDLGLWLAGRIIGARLLAWPQVARRLPPGGSTRAARWLQRRSGTVILGSRVTPGARLPLYLAAGACGTPLSAFAGWSLVAVAIWTPALVTAGALLGSRAAVWIAAGRLGSIVTVVLALLVWRLSLRTMSRRGRQEMAAAVSRLWRWEFWPMWLFYLPVAAWTAALAVRYRGYRTLTAANPGMTDGGVVGESKAAILARLDPSWTVPSVLIEPGAPGERAAAVSLAMRQRGWRFPVILKPDVGQRGTGVRLVRDARNAAEYFAAVGGPVVLQPYHPGPYEAGVFYYRMPDWSRGRILCVTDKHFPVVTGDGRSTIEALVWAHGRYRMQAALFMTRLGPRRHDVPADGEPVPLGLAGNHAQGAMFTDGRRLITPALEARIDAIARRYDGFYIGRFDVRYRDPQRFMAGEDLAIVELNGATAECTNVYDPAGTLIGAYRQLFRQWSLVFAIGAANRRHGTRTASARRLRALLRTHLTSRPALPVSD